MAGNKTDLQLGFQNIRIPFANILNFRTSSDSKDQRFVNCYFEPLQNPVTNQTTYYLRKRPGSTNRIQPPGGAATGRGVYSWKGDIYSVFNNKIYKNTTDLGVTMTTSTGQVAFAETHPAAVTQYLCINDGIKLFCINTGGTVTTVTTNFPSPNTGDLVYFDRYFFVMTSQGLIYNCNLDDPTTWDPSKFISTNMNNGPGISLTSQNNLILGMTDIAIQAFYDNANASGSPLNSYDQAIQQVGCAAQQSVVRSEENVYWVGTARIGDYTVYQLSGTSGLTEIATPPIRRYLSAEGTSIQNCTSFAIRMGGHFFYVLNLPVADRSFAYDVETKLWAEIEGTTADKKWGICSFADHDGDTILQSSTSGWIYTQLDNTFTTADGDYRVLARVGKLDFDDFSRKFYSRFALVGDQQTSSTPVTLTYSDDDYQTFVGTRTIDMSSARPFVFQLGSSYRRAWQLQYTGPNPLRLEAIELRVASSGE